MDLATKNKARKVLEEIGMDASTAVNILFRYIAKFGSFPIDLRDINGFRPHKAMELREAIDDSKRSSTTFKNASELLAELHS
jgi:addiction module RelB/DinJ family antitoxin